MRPAVRPLAPAVAAMGARVLTAPAPVAELSFSGAASDSREVTPGRMFFALPGERVDGFAFCAQAATSGAVAVVVAEGRGVPPGCEAITVLAVADPRKALGDLARAARREFPGRVVGVTGSNGKTTTKELIAAALSPVGPVLRTAGNRNTEVGLPLTILDARGDESFWVLEMAMRARGEIALLADIAAPHVGVVTNVAAAHLGRLGSLDEVARAKGEIFHGLGPAGIGVLPAGDARLEREAAHLPESRKVRFGGGPDAAVRVLDFVPSGAAGSVIRFAVGTEPVVARLPLAGEHNARNAAAALAVVKALGLPVQAAGTALAGATLPPHRSRLVAAGGRMILDDCYNANPASMSAALVTASTSAAGRTFAILGDMLELGPEAGPLHVALGREAAARRLAGVVALGALAGEVVRGAREAGIDPARAVVAADPVEAATLVAGWSAAGDWILVKASRGLRLERSVEALERALAGAPSKG